MLQNQHTCRLPRLWASSHACLLHRTSNNVSYNCTHLTGMLGTVAPGSAGISVQVTSGQCACLFFFLPTSSQGIIATGPAEYLPLRMFDYVALDQQTCLKPSCHICNSFMRLAGMLQYPCCRHVCCSCTRPPSTSVTIKLDQHACLLELHLPTDMFESVATEYQAHL